MAKLNKTILVVDDEPDARIVMREVLTQAGYAVREASGGEEALAILEKEPVDLMITDRAMPGLGGLELLKKLKDRKKTVPTLVVSAYGEESFWGEALKLGALDYLVKPFKSEEVLKIVRKTFGEAKGK